MSLCWFNGNFLRNDPEERSSQLLRGGSLKSRNIRIFLEKSKVTLIMIAKRLNFVDK
jgi:hypothetical protein